MPYLTKEKKSEIFDEKYFKGEKGSYLGGYNFDQEYKASIPLAKTFFRLGVRKALDAGCATGPLVKAFLDVGIEAYGVDVSKWAIENSPVAERLRWLDLDEDKLPFPSEYFDLVTMKFVIEHLLYPEKALKEVFRVLKPGGSLYIVTDKPENFTGGQVGHFNVRSRKAWLDLLKSIGFIPSKLFYMRFVAYLSFEKVHSGSGPIARKFLLHKMGLFGKVIRWIFKSTTYVMDRRKSTHLLLQKS